MLFLVTAQGDTLDDRIAKRFGHAPRHMLVDSDTWTVELQDGEVEELPRHGLERFKDRGLDGVIVGNLGPHAWDDVVELGWTAFLARRMTVREAVEKVVAGEIAPMEGPTMKRSIHHHAGAHHPHDDH